MEDFGSLWSYQENVDDLKQKLLYTTLELETLKMEANEALKNHKEEHNNLLNLLKIAYQARGAAKDQLQNLLNKHIPNIPRRGIPRVVSTKANSTITESNGISETFNPQSHISSPVDSLFDSVSSPEFSNINIAIAAAVDGSMSTGLVSPTAAAAAVIESIAKEKALPQQGKLLKAVMEAGPLLQTLLVAGPLPHWRNPPPLKPFINMPPFCIYPKPAANSSCVAQKPLNSSTYLQKSRMSSQMCSASMVNFSCCHAGSCQSNGMLFTSGAGISNQIPSGKRQRFQ